MMDALFVSLILSAISGCTFIAYKHPAGYRRIIDAIRPHTFWLLSLVGWFIGSITSSSRHLKQSLSEDPKHTSESVSYSINSLYSDVTIIIWAIGIAVVSAPYLTFLYYLPRFLICPQKNRRSRTFRSVKKVECVPLC